MTNLWVYFQKEINLNHTPNTGVSTSGYFISKVIFVLFISYYMCKYWNKIQKMRAVLKLNHFANPPVVLQSK